MQAGKALEHLEAVIQEYLKKYPDAKITRNARLTNRFGDKREIDVFVEANFNGEDIGIAFECKDYKRPLTAPTIEAFVTKINDIPQVTKGVIVTTSGYSESAQKTAIVHKVGLYLIDEIPLDQIIPDYRFYGAKVLAEPLFEQLNVHYFADTDDLSFDELPKMGYLESDKELDVRIEIFKAIYNMRTLCNLTAKFMELRKRAYVTKLKISPNCKLYIEDVHGMKYLINYFEVPVKVDLYMEQCQVASQKRYAKLDNGISVLVSEYNTSLSESSWVVLESEKHKESFYIKNQDEYYSPNIIISGKEHRNEI